MKTEIGAQGILALETAANGFPVHPVSHDTQRPLTLTGRNDATTDSTTIQAWWRSQPHALVSMPTGEVSGVVVLCVARGGLCAFNDLLAKLQCETVDDLSPCWARTPDNGLHVYHRFELGTAPESRCNDIAGGISTRALGGSVVIPGNVAQDGRVYRWGNPSASLYDAPPIPRRLLYLMTFSARDRDFIAGTPSMLYEVQGSAATAWRDVVSAHKTRTLPGRSGKHLEVRV